MRSNSASSSVKHGKLQFISNETGLLYLELISLNVKI